MTIGKENLRERAGSPEGLVKAGDRDFIWHLSLRICDVWGNYSTDMRRQLDLSGAKVLPHECCGRTMGERKLNILFRQ